MVNVRPPRMNQLVVVEINLLMERFQIVFVLQFDGLLRRTLLGTRSGRSTGCEECLKQKKGAGAPFSVDTVLCSDDFDIFGLPALWAFHYVETY